MNALTQYFRNLFAPLNSFTPEVKIVSIPYNHFVSIFQLANPEIFTLEGKVPSDDEDIAILGSIYEDIGSPVAGHLQNQDIKISTRTSYYRKDASFLSFVEYKNAPDSDPSREWATLLISTAVFTKGQPLFTPQFALSGYYTQIDGHLSLVLGEVLCRTETNGEDTYSLITNPIELVGAVAYGNRALLQLLSDRMIPPSANQIYLDPDKFLFAQEDTRALHKRTAESLRAEIEKMRTADNTDLHQSHHYNPS